MKIGITVDIRHSMFSAGHPNSSVAILEAFQVGNHDVTFLRKEQGRKWWDDVESLIDTYECEYVDTASGFDLVIEVGFFLTPHQRSTITSKSVWYCRKPALFTDMESTVYSCRLEGRNIEGLSEIWAADSFNGSDDLTYLKTLYPSLEIKVVPWLWTPTIVEAHRKEHSHPVWIQLNEGASKDFPWSLHICETNMSNTSSCTIPLVTVKHSDHRSRLAKVTLHNTECIDKSKFFVENIKNHCLLECEMKFVGRQRIIEWTREPKSIILSHSRFIGLKQANLEAAWVGLPVIHNNPILKELGCGLEELYYADNKIGEAGLRLTRAFDSIETIPYVSDLDMLSELRKRILYRFSPEAKASEWLALLTEAKPVEKIDTISEYVSERKEFTVLFTDMWSEFNVEHNTFTLCLEAGLHDTEVKGYSLKTLPYKKKPDIHIFGPFGDSWKEQDGPKIHFTGENTDPIDDPSIILNIGFKTIDDPRYLRMPLWMIGLDWFGADLSKLQNPLVLPIETCSSCPYVDLKREKFCAFIVSNPKNHVRNEAFHALNKYKTVDSAGRLFNTVGETIFAGLGGGGGEIVKHEFLKDYRFCLAYENEMADGYVTEKLLHAKAAGCIPIYWGSSSALTDFNPEGFINASNCSTVEEMVNLVRAVEEDPEKRLAMSKIPLFLPGAVDLVRSRFSKLVQTIVPHTIPKLLGRSKNVRRDPYFVTCATLHFWPSVHRWLTSLESHQKNGYPTILARVYVGDDIPDAHISKVTGEFPFATFIRLPHETPSDFSDFWEPRHYAWKLWILKEMAIDQDLSGRLIFYMDSGSSLIRMPEEWIHKTYQYKISFLEDPGQYNDRWCHEDFCKILRVTREEKESKQLAACLLMFISGDPLVKHFFSECYTIGCIRKCIVGEKWVKMNTGEIRGHRHDQSIMSILSQRYKIHRYPLEKVYCDTSARTTYFNNLCVYVHRNNYISHIPFLPGIDDTFVVNMDRRTDRRKAFLEAHPTMKGRVRRHCAYDGLALNLTPKLATLFKPNDFFWKKAVMGCALSHLKLWTMLLHEPRDIENYLILEDDVRFVRGWEDVWSKIYPNLSEDWECIYLGGVLPPNKEGFKTVMEPVPSCPELSQIAPNTLFGQTTPSRQFHFCTYGYVLSRRGAKRLLDVIKLKGGIWTSADHVLFNSLDKDNVYVVNPLVAGASQDDDPAYIHSDFNDFSRKDTFDSDLWNNDERFTMEEVSRCLGGELDIMGALHEIPIGNQVRRKYVSLDVTTITDKTIFEGPWIREFIPDFTLHSVSSDELLDSGTTLVVRRPLWDEQLRWIEKLCRTGRRYTIIHMSDEFCQDPIHFYSFPQIKSVLRFYPRPDVPKNTLTIPLGYHWQNKKEPVALSLRAYTWSFCGTGWLNRKEELNPLLKIEPCYSEFYPDWNYSGQKSEEEFISLLRNTRFIPCPRGNNVETYRIYEALECGCIPVFIELPRILEGIDVPFLVADSWVRVGEIIREKMSNLDDLESYHRVLLSQWKKYKEELRVRVVKLLV